MSVIRANCPTCGDVEMKPRALTLHHCLDDLKRSSYSFVCQKCKGNVSKPVPTTNILLLLETSGCIVKVWKMPREMMEIHEGDLIGHDDLLDFHQIVETGFESWLDGLTAMVRDG